MFTQKHTKEKYTKRGVLSEDALDISDEVVGVDVDVAVGVDVVVVVVVVLVVVGSTEVEFAKLYVKLAK